MSTQRQIASSVVRDFLNKEHFTLSPVIGDGLCLLRSVEVSLKHQGIKTYIYRSLKTRVKEFQQFNSTHCKSQPVLFLTFSSEGIAMPCHGLSRICRALGLL
jgi:hypothetical protein